MFILDDLLLATPLLFSAWQALSLAMSERGAHHAQLIDADDVEACRARVPAELGLKPTNALMGGHMYSGNDPEHLHYLHGYLDVHADAASGEDKRRILAFKALQGREGSTAAINTYDNQVVTWGTGWGGLGGLPRVMGHLDPAVLHALHACGLDYLGGGQWSVVDDHGRVVTGKKEALEAIRSTPALLNLLIHVAKDPATRDAVTDAQLRAFLETSGQVPGSETIATQALFNLVTHLKHWAPGYVDFPLKHPLSIVEEAARVVPGEPSPERDRGLAREIVRGFYARAGKWTPDWKQMQQYTLHHLKEDGLDVSGDPMFTAASAPGAAQKTAAGCGANWSSFKTAGGCGNWDFPNNDTCGNWGPWGAQFRSADPEDPRAVKIVGGRGGLHAHGHPWYRGGVGWSGGTYDGVLVGDGAPCWAVVVGPGGALACAGALPIAVVAPPGHVVDAQGRVLGVARAVPHGYDLVPLGFERAHEVFHEPDVKHVAGFGADPRFGGVQNVDGRMVDPAKGLGLDRGHWHAMGNPRSAGGPGEHWGEVQDDYRTVGGSGAATPEQVVKRGVVEAVRNGEWDPPQWTQVKVVTPGAPSYDLMLMNEPIAVQGLRLPTSLDDAVAVSNLIGALPITPAIAEARWRSGVAGEDTYPTNPKVKRAYAKPLTDATGELFNDPGQVARHNALVGPNTGEFRDGAWKEVTLHPNLTQSGRGSMAQYGFRDTASHMFEHGGPSNHSKEYKGYSDTPTYVSRGALKDGVLVDLLDEYAAGGPLTAALPGWLIARFQRAEVA